MSTIALPPSPKAGSGDGVTPFKVTGIVNYDRLIEQFGTEPLTPELLDKFARITKREPHHLMRRGIFFSHRQLNEFLDAYEKGHPVFLYTGRGPTSDSLHLGHILPIEFTAYLQSVFDCIVVFQMADDEKYYFNDGTDGKKELSFEEITRCGRENTKDIIACGFNSKKTFMFSNREYSLGCREYQLFALETMRIIPEKKIRAIFGELNTVGQMMCPFYQAIAAFSRSYPHLFGDKLAYCLVPYAIDQDPYFRLARDIAPRMYPCSSEKIDLDPTRKRKMGLLKPHSIICKFLPPLTGFAGKASSTGANKDSTIFMSDTPSVIAKKIKKYAFSGGGGDGSMADHVKYGGNIETDMPFQYLRHFLRDDVKLEEISKSFANGEMTCGQIKEILVQVITELVTEHQKRRSLVTDEIIAEVYSTK
jgi:tryptophanyl-tRNA synthetase